MVPISWISRCRRRPVLPAADAAAAARPDTVRTREVALVGESSSSTPAFFGEISGFAFDRSGSAPW